MKKYLFLALAILAFVACEPTKDKQMKRISTLEKEILVGAKSISTSKADSLLEMYNTYIAEFPKDSNSAIILFKAADVCANVKYCDKAIVYLERLVGDFPEHYLVEAAYFRMAQVYEQCQDKEKAKEYYKSFMEKYPKSRLATDAAVMLQMMDMPNEMDMIREFEQKNSQTNTTEK